MSTVKHCLDRKPKTIVSVPPHDKVVKALELMRDKRVRSILVLEDEKLVGIVSQGDCAIKVLLPGANAAETSIESVMTRKLITVKLEDTLESCMATMVKLHIRHLPVIDAGTVIGVVSIGDIVKEILSLQGNQIDFLETFIKGHEGN
ncbi:Arabinose 5-phosphate isomerase KdsD [Polaromonas vacuolata]|uniref:Arabinose 5-phosphate isomerase KdsD n=1 Tax=Polaromonas vacuolata TaxID=37448 RepID=A0A6H2HAD7_9BURK|nr:CBS domain-containing protein [Polaromonas vacuolata]QJC56763.1 Arabinose 5-phosphate isomerase KdsD [Polaromonas vacuolata]